MTVAEMGFVYDVGGATFKHRKHLQRHVAGVHGEGFTCTVCHKIN